MRALPAAAAALIGLSLLPASASASARPTLDLSGFRYVREVEAPHGAGPIELEPDASLLAHSRPGLADLRIVDSSGSPVAWRTAPKAEAPDRRLPALDSGTRDGRAVALFDLGPQRSVRNRLELDVAGRGFVGRAVVFGSDDRQGPFTRLSETEIYDVSGGDGSARSTLAVFPPSDHRYLEVEATGIDRIAGATVEAASGPPEMLRRPAKERARSEEGRRTSLTLDLGLTNVPVDEVSLSAADAAYDRPVRVSGSNDGKTFVPIGFGRMSRFPGSSSAPLAAAGRFRYIRAEIENGDDPPLRNVAFEAFGRSRAILIDARSTGLRVAYGNPSAAAPDYEFARLPASTARLERVRLGTLDKERSNGAYEEPADTRSFLARNPGVVLAALIVAALALGATGVAVLRSRPREAA